MTACALFSTNSAPQKTGVPPGEWIVSPKLFSSSSSATLFAERQVCRTSGVTEWTTGASGDALPRSAVMVA